MEKTEKTASVITSWIVLSWATDNLYKPILKDDFTKKELKIKPLKSQRKKSIIF
jgi:hypothetical protein